MADLAIVQRKSQQGLDLMHTLYAGSTGIEYEHIAIGRVAHDPQYMRMSADQYIGRVMVELLAYPGGIVAGIARYMGDPDLQPLYEETFVFGILVSDVLAVYIAIYGAYRAQGAERIGHGRVAYIARMPDLVYIAQYLQCSRLHMRVGIRYQSYLSQCVMGCFIYECRELS